MILGLILRQKRYYPGISEKAYTDCDPLDITDQPKPPYTINTMVMERGHNIIITCWFQKKTVFIHFDQANARQLIEVL